MTSNALLTNSQLNINENDILLEKSTMHADDDDEEEEEEATVPKLDEKRPEEATLLSDDEHRARKLSLSSNSSKTSDYPDICRICHCEGTAGEPLISPCSCLGTMQYLHQSCLQRWIKSAGVKSCELCKFEFIMHAEIKPFTQWQKLDMNIVERRKVMCSVAFNLIAVICVLGSLYILIDKTREQVKTGKLQWSFWTKLVVVAIGFTGGLVFLYVQCKMYFHLCIRWRQFNQRIVIHSIHKQHRKSSSASIIRAVSSTPRSVHCIVTVLDASDLLPLSSNTTPIVNAGINATGSTPALPPLSSITNRNRRHEHSHRRNVLHRFLIFHRSDPSTVSSTS